MVCCAIACHHCDQRYIVLPKCQTGKSIYWDAPWVCIYWHSQLCADRQHRNCFSPLGLRRQSDLANGLRVRYENRRFSYKVFNPRHPFIKGKVECLIRFVKETYLQDRVFWNITNLNRASLECKQRYNTCHRATDGSPNTEHIQAGARVVQELVFTPVFLLFLCPERNISFVNFEGRRFGVPFHYRGITAKDMRKYDMIYIYSIDMKQLLISHDVSWSKRDRYCSDQYATLQLEKFLTMPVKTGIVRLPEPTPSWSFDKFNFGKKVD